MTKQITLQMGEFNKYIYDIASHHATVDEIMASLIILDLISSS
jgi:hypothetical protein